MLWKQGRVFDIPEWEDHRSFHEGGGSRIEPFHLTINFVDTVAVPQLCLTLPPHRLPSLSFTISQSLLKFMSIESLMPSNHLILSSPSRPAFSLSSIRVFSSDLALRISWPNIWASASASVLPMNIQDWFPLEWTGWISLQSKGFSGVFSNITVQKHQFFGTQLSLWSNSHIHTWLLEKS